MSIDISEYKILYIKTARDLIVTLKKSMEMLKKDFCDKVAIAEFHRAAHSFKSQSLIMGYTKTGLAGRVLEQLFAAIKEKKECIDIKKNPAIETLVEKMNESLDSIEQSGNESDLTGEIESLQRLTSLPLM